MKRNVREGGNNRGKGRKRIEREKKGVRKEIGERVGAEIYGKRSMGREREWKGRERYRERREEKK